MERVLTRREMNRTLLVRQSLIERSGSTPEQMIERLAGMQAQEPGDPYIALWSRIVDFRPEVLSDLIGNRSAVRASGMRATIHLFTSGQARSYIPLTAPVKAGTFRSQFRKLMGNVEPEPVVEAGRKLLEDQPLTRSQLSSALADRWPEADPVALGQAVTHLLPLIQMPPRGQWGKSRQATWGLFEKETGLELEVSPGIEGLIIDYLRAFGPASVADLRNWSRITRLKPVIESMRSDLRTYRDENGRELFDHAEGVIADPGLEVPPRFLPEYDNLLLGHEDRSRVLAGLGPGGGSAFTGRWIGTLLVNGFFRAFWKLAQEGDSATLTIRGFVEDDGDPPGTREAIEAEGEKLALLLGEDSARLNFV